MSPASPSSRPRPVHGGLLLVLLGLLLLVAFPGRAFEGAERWITVTDPDAGYRVRMPVAPRREAGPGELLGAEVWRVRLRARDLGRTFTLTWFDVQGTRLVDPPPERLLDALRDRWLSNLRGDLVLERSFGSPVEPGRELVAVRQRAGRPQVLHRARLFLDRGRVVCLEYRDPYASWAPTDLQGFFRTFQAIPKATS